jgi:ABC-type glycerol-3-phosphate transport system substrate-binding protein
LIFGKDGFRVLKNTHRVLGTALVVGFLLSACNALPIDLPWPAGATPTATVMPGETGAPSPTPGGTTAPTATPEPVSELTVWVPPELDPAQETEASILFANQIQLFSDLHEGLQITVRVKAPSGPGGLLDALTAASAAAPEALPDLILLDRPDLERAALKGLVFPFDQLTEIPDDSDWYRFTRDMALLQGSTFGLPFAADSLVLIYRPLTLPEFPNTWEALLEEDSALAFPADDDQALFALTLYQAAGGIVQDNQRRPVLEVDPLSEVFKLFQSGVVSGGVPEWLTQYQTDGQAWTAFREGQTDIVVTWLSNYLKELPADTAVSPLLPMSAGTVSLGSGLSWALATPQEHRQPLAAELAEFLVQPDFLTAWNAAAGYLPPRPSALETWENQSLKATLSQVALMTQLRPSNDVLSSLGPILREGTRQVLLELADPVQAAQVAVENLESQ